MLTTSIIIYIGYEENNVFQYVILRSARKRNMEYDLLVSDFWMNKGCQRWDFIVENNGKT